MNIMSTNNIEHIGSFIYRAMKVRTEFNLKKILP